SVAPPAILSRCLHQCWRMLFASATLSLEISSAGMGKPCTSLRRIIHRLPTPRHADVHLFVPVRTNLLVAWWRPKALFTSLTLRQTSATLNDAFRQSLTPSNLGACERC